MPKDFLGNEIKYDLFGNPLKKNVRESVKSSQKSKVFDDQNGKCKNLLKLGHTEYHHVKFVCRGGKSKTDNLVALCANCHSELHKEEKADKANKKRNNKKINNNFLDFRM